MPKKQKRMTRVDKIALSKVTTSHKTASQIGVDSSILDGLALRGYVVCFKSVGPALYQITEAGRDFLGRGPSDAR